MKPVNIAMIGGGFISQFHLEALQRNPDAQVVAICDLRADVAKSVAGKFNIPRWETQAEVLFKDPTIDAVILALPTCFRTELALQALKNGKHVLTEKPVAMNAEEVKALKAAQGDRVVAACSSRMSLLQTAQKAREAVEASKLGDIRVVHCRAVLAAGARLEKPYPVWRLRSDLNGGGILANWGCYELDLLFSILGWKLEPQAVLAQTWQINETIKDRIDPSSNAETHAIAMLRFKDGSVFHYDRAEMTSTISQESWQIVGTKGTLRLHLYEAKAEVYLDVLDPVEGVKTEVLFHNENSEERFHDLPSIDFIEAIRTGKKPHTGMDESLLIAQVIDGIYESAKTQNCITFS